MSKKYKHIIYLEETDLAREIWMEEHNLTEKEIYEDEEGQFYIDYVEIELDEPGGAYEKKVYLPPNI